MNFGLEPVRCAWCRTENRLTPTQFIGFRLIVTITAISVVLFYFNFYLKYTIDNKTTVPIKTSFNTNLFK